MANTFLDSFCTRPMVAKKAVESRLPPPSPWRSAHVEQSGGRAVMYTPAVTWSQRDQAETGVGPAIASGSQTYSDLCDFPAAPTSTTGKFT